MYSEGDLEITLYAMERYIRNAQVSGLQTTTALAEEGTGNGTGNESSDGAIIANGTQDGSAPADNLGISGAYSTFGTSSELDGSASAPSAASASAVGAASSALSLKVTFDELKTLVAFGARVIAHLTRGHYVLIQSIDEDGTVHYYEMNAGPNGEEMKSDSETFQMSFSGNILSDRAPPTLSETCKILTAQEALKVRGNFEPLTLLIIALSVISAALSFIDNEICQLISQILGIATLAFSVFNVIMKLPLIISNFTNGLLQATTWIANVTTNGLDVMTTAIKGLCGNIENIAGNAILEGIKGISYNIAVTQGLSFFNINSDVSRVTAAIMTGGYLRPDNYFAGAFLAGARETVSIVGRETGLDPYVTQLIGTAGYAIGDAFLTGIDVSEMLPDGTKIIKHLTGFDALRESLKTTILPNITSELAYIGVTKLGETIGLDPRISYLAGIGLRSSIRAGFGSDTGGGESIFDAEKLLKGALDGMAQGVSSIGINYLVEESRIDPLLANIGFSAIALGINGTLQAMFSGDNNFDIFKFMTDTYKKNALVFLGTGASNDSWMKAVYMSQIENFSEIIKTRGIVDALNSYGTGFFNGIAINAVTTAGFSIGEYFKEKWDRGEKEQIILRDGRVVDGVRAENTETILLFDSNGNIVGLKDEEKFIYGEIGIDGQNKMAILNGYIEGEYIAGLGVYMDVEKGYVTNARIIAPDTGETLYWIRPGEGESYLSFDNYDDYINYEIEEISNKKFSVTFIEDDVYKVREELEFQDLSEENKRALEDLGLRDIDSLGYFAFEISPEDQLYRANMAMELNEDIKNFITLYPSLAPEVLKIFIEETKDLPIYGLLNREMMKSLTSDYAGDKKIDLNGFRKYDEVENVLKENYDSNKTQSIMFNIKTIRGMIKDVDLIDANANLLLGIKTQFYTENGMLMEVSGYTGEHFIKGSDELYFDEDKNLVDVTFNIKNGEEVEAVVSKKLLNSFTRTIISSSGNIKNEAGTYQVFSNTNLETNTYQFVYRKFI
ncbi:membrane protein [Candidatus Omnitrophus magneticus]|uniref:Membrane protein n=1 Tax=Candidatus Omnitrophus magneticus TaxID=1609969 RepID=A0A0F0CIY9_9BACT|nr:membrane protein [Candidatus Omnitrophus magneticus]